MTPPRLEGASVLVTGGAGFIGSHLVDALLERDARVRVLDDFSSGRLENLASALPRVEILEGDIRDFDACRRACEGVEIVFHEAARGSVPRSMADPAATLAVNILGTANVFDGCRDAGVRRVVYASSSSVYGDSARLPKVEGEEGEPLSPYALSKSVNEETARVFARCYGMELVGLRYFNVYGPRQDPEGPYAAVIPRFFAAVTSGRPPVIFGDGRQSRDFTFVGDAVRANLLAADAPPEACGTAYNVAGGVATTVFDLAARIGAILGRPAAPMFEAARPGDVMHSAADLSRARGHLGFEPRTELAAGLAASAAFYTALPSGRTT